jgi:septal ring factor EnvC (AmiA/AmiB activator)
MDRDNTYLGVNDYLDLYLLAKNLGDQTWKKEILEKMEKIRKEDLFRQVPEQSINNLWNKYKEVNTEIIDLYRKLYNNKSNTEMMKEIKKLKKELIAVSRQIYDVERKSHS